MPTFTGQEEYPSLDAEQIEVALSHLKSLPEGFVLTTTELFRSLGLIEPEEVERGSAVTQGRHLLEMARL